MAEAKKPKTNPHAKAVQDKIRELIQQSGMTQEEFAAKAKMKFASLREYLRTDPRMPSLEFATRIAWAGGRTVDYFGDAFVFEDGPVNPVPKKKKS